MSGCDFRPFEPGQEVHIVYLPEYRLDEVLAYLDEHGTGTFDMVQMPPQPGQIHERVDYGFGFSDADTAFWFKVRFR
jgi:hypothetical protein